MNAIKEELKQVIKRISPSTTPTEGRSRANSLVVSSTNAQLSQEEYEKLEKETELHGFKIEKDVVSSVGFMGGVDGIHETNLTGVKPVVVEKRRKSMFG